MKTDVCIAGAGLVGLATAYQILKNQPNTSLVVLEKEAQVAAHQSGNNSGVIHSGIYYTPNSKKAINCIRGYQYLIDFCNQHQIAYDICGKIIVASNVNEEHLLQKIYQRGLANGLNNLDILDQEAMKKIEPYVTGVSAIRVPQAGIADYKFLAAKLVEQITNWGGQVLCNAPVKAIASQGQTQIIETANQRIESSLFINCAGLYADRLIQLAGHEPGFQILPFRGEYYELKKEKQHLVNHLIYPVPNPNFPFLGVHFTRMIHGGIESGPNAVLAFRREGYKKRDIHLGELWETIRFSGFRKLARQHWRTEVGELHRSFSKRAYVKALKKLIPSITAADVKRGGAGVRAMACRPDGSLVDDYLFIEKKGQIHVGNAPSPAATSCLSIGETIGQMAIKQLT